MFVYCYTLKFYNIIIWLKRKTPNRCFNCNKGFELIWFYLIWFDWNWIGLIWFDLIWFDLNWIELNWIDWEASERHLGGIWETSGLQGSTQETPRRHPGGTQEAPGRHPGDTQEAPRGIQGTQESSRGLGSKKVNTSQLKCNKMKKTIISRGVFEGRCHQVPRLATKSIRYPPRRWGRIAKGSLSKPPEPLRWNLFGEINVFMYIFEILANVDLNCKHKICKLAI